jgi:hypothetical protein
MAPRAHGRGADRLRQRDLDSEGENQRSFFERQPPPRLTARAHVGRRSGQSEPRNHEGGLRIRSSSGAPHVLANKHDRSHDDAAASVVGAHARGRRGVLMRAPRGRRVGTPDLAQEAGVLPNCQRQHDRKQNWSKHVMLATHKGKSCASRKDRDLRKFRPFQGLSPPPARRTCGISPVGAENPPAPLLCLEQPCALASLARGASHVLTRCSVRYKETTLGTPPS